MNVGRMNGKQEKKTAFPKRLLFGLYEKILYQIITVIFELQVGIFNFKKAEASTSNLKH